MARITISVDHVVAPVDRRILGGFAEHLGRCVYGGIYDDGSPLWGQTANFRNGSRAGIEDLTRDARLPSNTGRPRQSAMNLPRT